MPYDDDKNEAWSTKVFRDIEERDRDERAGEGGFGDKFKVSVSGLLSLLRRKKKEKKK